MFRLFYHLKITDCLFITRNLLARILNKIFKMFIFKLGTNLNDTTGNDDTITGCDDECLSGEARSVTGKVTCRLQSSGGCSVILLVDY